MWGNFSSYRGGDQIFNLSKQTQSKGFEKLVAIKK